MIATIMRAFTSATPVAAVALLLVSVLDASPAGQDALQADHLVARWKATMYEKFDESKASTVEGTDKLIDRFLSVGAVNAVRRHMPESEIAAKETALARFALTIVRYGERRGDGSVELVEAAFDQARAKTCPLDPFCQ